MLNTISLVPSRISLLLLLETQLFSNVSLISIMYLMLDICIHKYMWMNRVGAQWALLDYVQSDWHAKERMLDVNRLRGLAGRMLIIS